MKYAAVLLSLTVEAWCAPVSGRVVNSVNGQPLGKTLVQLTRAADRGPRGAPAAVLTDAQGAFRFAAVPDGTYRLSASRSGFIRADYINPSRGFTLAVGSAALADLKIALMPAAVVAGSVVDEDGDPVEGARVEVLRSSYTPDGDRRWTSVQSVVTNDLGQYRLASIAPGPYRLGVSKRARPAPPMQLPGPPAGRGPMAGRGPLEGRAGPGAGGPGFGPMQNGPMQNRGTQRGGLPMTASSDQQFLAQQYPALLHLKPGAELSGIDFRLRKTRVFQVGGVVTGLPENPVQGRGRGPGPGVVLTLSPESGGQPSGTAVARNGAFLFPGVLPGAYTLWAFQPGRTAEPMFARVAVEVGGADVDGIVLAMQPAARLTGRIVYEGGTPPSGTRFELQFRAPESPAQMSGRARVNGQVFETTLDGTSGARYRVRASNLPPGFYLKEVRSGQQNALEEGFTIPTPAPLEVVLAAGAASVGGTVRDGSDRPVPRAVVTLAPIGAAPPDAFRYVIANETGGFQIDGLRPGSYRILAWERLERGAHQDREFLKTFEPAALPLRLAPSARESVQLGAIPAEAVPVAAPEV